MEYLELFDLVLIDIVSDFGFWLKVNKYQN